MFRIIILKKMTNNENNNSIRFYNDDNDDDDDDLKQLLQIDNQSWLSEKPISVLQLDPADRAVLKIAGLCLNISFSFQVLK